MVSLKEGANVLIRCAIQFDTLRLDSSVVEHLACIQGAWVQSSVWPLFSSCSFNSEVLVRVHAVTSLCALGSLVSLRKEGISKTKLVLFHLFHLIPLIPSYFLLKPLILGVRKE